MPAPGLFPRRKPSSRLILDPAYAAHRRDPQDDRQPGAGHDEEERSADQHGPGGIVDEVALAKALEEGTSPGRESMSSKKSLRRTEVWRPTAGLCLRPTWPG